MRAGIEIAAWWVAGWLIWTATLSSVSAAELVAGAVAAGVCAVLARLARQAMGRQPGLTPRMWSRWLTWALVVPVAAAADLMRLVRWLFAGAREPSDGDRAVRVSTPAGDGATAITWRQGAALAVSSTPGSVVVGIEPDEGRLDLDQLVTGWPGLDQRVSG